MRHAKIEKYYDVLANAISEATSQYFSKNDNELPKEAYYHVEIMQFGYIKIEVTIQNTDYVYDEQGNPVLGVENTQNSKNGCIVTTFFKKLKKKIRK